MAPNSSNTCIQCLKSKINISEGMQTEVQIFHCKECNRFKTPKWVHLEPESPKLLNFCLKSVKGLNKGLKLIDASFIYTEPHSKRLNVKVTIQKEVLNGTILQKDQSIFFIISNLQCEDCKKTYTPHLWKAQVQVRQKVDHKRTFFFLEQLILRHRMDEKCLNITQAEGGLNFQFESWSFANVFTNFIQKNISCRSIQSKQLITHNEK